MTEQNTTTAGDDQRAPADLPRKAWDFALRRYGDNTFAGEHDRSIARVAFTEGWSAAFDARPPAPTTTTRPRLVVSPLEGQLSNCEVSDTQVVFRNGTGRVDLSGPHAYSDVQSMARQWHDASDHAEDGEPYGGPLCNCDRIAARAKNLGWAVAR